MVSSFRGLNDLIQMKKGSGLVTDWKQAGGSLLVGGDSRIIRIWDAHTETQIMVGDTPVHFRVYLYLLSVIRTWTQIQIALSRR